MAVVERALRNILDFFISALKETSREGSAFMGCFKSATSWPVVFGKSDRRRSLSYPSFKSWSDSWPIVVMRRCEAIIRYCLGREDTEYVRSSLGTVRFVKVTLVSLLRYPRRYIDDCDQSGKPQEERKARCGMIAAEAKKTIWLYEAWWRAPSLRNARGIRIEKGQRAHDALADAFMQAQEGSLFHEVSLTASISPPCERSLILADCSSSERWPDEAFTLQLTPFRKTASKSLARQQHGW